MGCFGPNLSFGIQRLIDSQQRFVKASHNVYLRIKNFDLPTDEEWAQLGFAVAPTGTDKGTTDILIDPPASSTMVSMHNIGMSGGKLRMGAREFLISATFVNAQQFAQGLSDPDLVFRGPRVVGLVIDGKLFSIETYSHQEIGGDTVTWILAGNDLEIS